MDLREKIRTARNVLGITQGELAKNSGISIQNIKKLETQVNTNPTNNTLQKLAIALKVDSDYFVSQVSPNQENSIPHSKNSPQTLNQDDFYFIPKLNITASAGGGNELEGLECYESGQTLAIDKAFFKAIPSHNIKAIRVDGYSMIPLLFPDSWVIFEEGNEFKGDGLYIINYANQLMVKLLQLNPITNILEIISINKDYKSYEVSVSESQELCLIRGKVLRSII